MFMRNLCVYLVHTGFSFIFAALNITAMKRRIGSYKDYLLVEGDSNTLVGNKEVLVTHENSLTLIRLRKEGGIKTYVVMPLEVFNNKRK